MIWCTNEKLRRREVVLAAFGERCAYCTCQDYARLTIDHVRPTCDGGNDAYDNLVTACRTCNGRKGRQPAFYFMAHRPEVMREIERYRASRAWEAVLAWRPARPALRCEAMKTEPQPNQAAADRTLEPSSPEPLRAVLQDH